MDVWDILQDLDAASDEQNLWQKIYAGFEQFGFNQVVYMNFAQNKQKTYSNLPHEFREYYRKENLQEVDPFVQHCLTKNFIRKTGEHFLQYYPNIKTQERQFAYDVSEAGFRAGISIPFPKALGFGGWNVGMDLSKNDALSLIQRYEKDVYLIALYAQQVQHNFHRPGLSLTPREYDCLSYTALGYQNAEIAKKLYLSEATIEYHLRRARKKLGAKNREHAIAIAMKYRLIHI